MKVQTVLILVFVIVVVVLAYFFLAGSPETQAPTGTKTTTGGGLTMNQARGFILSSIFENNGKIPAKYTCDGDDVSPPLRWEGRPDGTASYVLIVDDPDAPIGVFTHWVLYNIPADLNSLPENIPKQKETKYGLQGRNDFGKIGYGGPCPPKGKPHRYFFKLYALDIKLNLPPGASKREVGKKMEGHILAQAQIIGLYGRG